MPSERILSSSVLVGRRRGTRPRKRVLVVVVVVVVVSRAISVRGRGDSSLDVLLFWRHVIQAKASEELSGGLVRIQGDIEEIMRPEVAACTVI